MPYNIWCDGCKNHIGMGELPAPHPAPNYSAPRPASPLNLLSTVREHLTDAPVKSQGEDRPPPFTTPNNWWAVAT